MTKLIPKGIVIHTTASRWGDAAAVDAWHKERGWGVTVDGHTYHIGYHAVILNGYRTYGALSASNRAKTSDGLVQAGRPEWVQGAHCKAGGQNARSLGVSLVGNPGWDGYPTPAQVESLVDVCAGWCKKYGILPSDITQHSDWESDKPSCASLDGNGGRPALKEVRERVRQALGVRVKQGVNLRYKGTPLQIPAEIRDGEVWVAVRALLDAVGAKLVPDLIADPQGKDAVWLIDSSSRLPKHALPAEVEGGIAWVQATPLLRILGLTYRWFGDRKELRFG